MRFCIACFIVLFFVVTFLSADNADNNNAASSKAPVEKPPATKKEQPVRAKVPLPPLVEKYLHNGQLKKGEQELLAHLKKHPQDDEARFGLGVLQFFRSIEGVTQSLHRYGFMSDLNNFYRFTSQESTPKDLGIFADWPQFTKSPQTIAYSDMRKILEQFIIDVKKAEQTLAQVKDKNVKLRLRLSKIRFDIDGNGKAIERESFFGLNAASNAANSPEEKKDKKKEEKKAEDVKEIAITFDYADVLWLRGYTHVFMGLNEFLLSLDWKDSFERTAHLAFPKVKSPYDFLRIDSVEILKKIAKEAEKNKDNLLPYLTPSSYYADSLAFLQLAKYDVVEPKRLKKSLFHCEQVIKLSRLTWKAIEAETDDMEEWIPNPQQTGVLQVKVTPQIIAGWKTFLNETEAILSGKKLVSHWRVTDGRAINVRKFFTKSKQFAPVLLIQGSDVALFLEKGETTKLKFWTELLQKFGSENGGFFGFALWFN
ncbi:hypothetical protein MNBD_PLANCTO02-323 [hydrothermal vent metagenome]|uniref:Uncharacterized protein n=1 Tax=hydrothermal vent metagenome TaxID=652676 RepID=A0A3B1D702_9ZZZZ